MYTFYHVLALLLDDAPVSTKIYLTRSVTAGRILMKELRKLTRMCPCKISIPSVRTVHGIVWTRLPNI